jgi:hypothetical protein
MQDEAEYRRRYNVLYELSEVDNLFRRCENIDRFTESSRFKNTCRFMFRKYGTYLICFVQAGSLDVFYVDSQKKSTYLNKCINIKDRRNMDEWVVLGSIIKTRSKKYTDFDIHFYYEEVTYMLKQLAERLDDTCFVINLKDMCAIRSDDRLEPSMEVVGSASKKLPNFIYSGRTVPVFSFSKADLYSDIALPTPDDINRIYGLKAADVDDIPFNKRINKAVFRGSFTGSSANPLINQRILVSQLSKRHPALIDAGIVGSQGINRYRKDMYDKRPKLIDRNIINLLTVGRLDYSEQRRYKYVIYIEGNVAAYRGAYLFSTGSVVLWVRPSKHKLWFEDLLENGRHCIFIDQELSNLVEVVNQLNANQVEAMYLVEGARTFFNQHLTKEPIEDYVVDVINEYTRTYLHQ